MLQFVLHCTTLSLTDSFELFCISLLGNYVTLNKEIVLLLSHFHIAYISKTIFIHDYNGYTKVNEISIGLTFSVHKL